MIDMNIILKEFIEKKEIPIYGVASVEGFKNSLPGWHPKQLMPQCKSVIVFGHPFIHHPWIIDNKTHVIDYSWFAINESVYQKIADCRGGLVNLIDGFGLGVACFGGFWISSEPTLSYRLVQYEAGVGVFGRFGVCINPEFGCNYVVGVLLTEADLTPTDKNRLTDFKPCENCTICSDVCPVKAIDASKVPEKAYNMEICFRFILKLRDRLTKDEIFHYEDPRFCGRCFSVCPWGPENMNLNNYHN